MVIQTSYPHLSISLELNIPLQRAISAVPVCRWSALIRRSQIQKGVWHWNLTALLMISVFLFLFSVTSFPTACQKRCVWGFVAPLYMKLCVVQRKDCGFFFCLFMYSIHSSIGKCRQLQGNNKVDGKNYIFMILCAIFQSTLK